MTTSPYAAPVLARIDRPVASGRIARLVFAAAAMFLASSAFYNFSLAPDRAAEAGVVGADHTRGDPINMFGWIALYAVSGVVVMRSLWTRGLELRLALVLPFALYVLASAAWAFEPWQSLVFAVMLVADIVVADALAEQVHPARLLSALAWVVAVSAAISLALLVTYPDSVITEPDRPGLFISGEFSGVFGHKVHMGVNTASAILVMLFLRDAVPWKWARWLGLAACGAGLVLANSASAIVALGVSIILILAVRAMPRLRAALFGVVSSTTLLVSVLLPHIDLGPVTGLVGRSANLTGRTDFWALAPDYIAEHPWLGYGYGGFFQRDPYSQVWDLWSHSEYFFTPNFHNSALDVAILLGLIGLTAYLVILGVGLSVCNNLSLGPSAEVLACILILFTASSATDFQFMRHNCLATVLLFYAYFVGGRAYAKIPARGAPRSGA